MERAAGRGSLSGNGPTEPRPGSPSGHSRLGASSHIPAAASPALQYDLRRDAALDHLTHPASILCSPCPPGQENQLCPLLCPLAFAHNSCHSTCWKICAQAPAQQRAKKSKGPSLQHICSGSSIPAVGPLPPPRATSSFPSDPGSLPLRLLPFWVINSV